MSYAYRAAGNVNVESSGVQLGPGHSDRISEVSQQLRWPLFQLHTVATVLWHVPSGLIPVPKMHVDNEPMSLYYGQEGSNL
jgi:hypothetical protein